MSNSSNKRRNLLPLNRQIRKGVQTGRKLTKDTLFKIPIVGKRLIQEKKFEEEIKSPEKIREEEIRAKSWIKLILTSEMRYHILIFTLIIIGFSILAYIDEPNYILFLSFGFTCGYGILGIGSLSYRIFQRYLSGTNGALIGVTITMIITILTALGNISGKINKDSLWLFSMGLFLLWTCLQAHFFAVLILGVSNKVVHYIKMHKYLVVLFSLLFTIVPFLTVSFLVFIGLEKSSNENEIQWIFFLTLGFIVNLIFFFRNLWILIRTKESKQLWFRVFFFYAVFLSYMFYRGFSLISNYQELTPFPEVRWLDLILMFLTALVATKAFSEKSIQLTAGSFDLPLTSAAFFGFALTSTYAAGQFWLFTEWKGDVTQISILTNALVLISGLVVIIFLFRRFSEHERQIWKQQERRLMTSKKLQVKSKIIRKNIQKLHIKRLVKENDVDVEK
ncbi:MAG: hypothetical protein ACFFCQ_08825 [Promethearchaeota archaeon]